LHKICWIKRYHQLLTNPGMDLLHDYTFAKRQAAVSSVGRSRLYRQRRGSPLDGYG
jgi:hypothetical protein